MIKTSFHYEESQDNDRSVQRLVKILTGAAWTALMIGLLLSLFSMNYFSDQNATLMVGMGFMVGSVFIYIIRTAIHLVHAPADRIE